MVSKIVTGGVKRENLVETAGHLTDRHRTPY